MLICVKTGRPGLVNEDERYSELRSYYRALVRAITTGNLKAAQDPFYCIDSLQCEGFGLSIAAQRVFDELGHSVATENVPAARRTLERYRSTLRAQAGFDEELLGQDSQEDEGDLGDNEQRTLTPASGSRRAEYPLFDDYAIEAVGDELPTTASYRFHS